MYAAIIELRYHTYPSKLSYLIEGQTYRTVFLCPPSENQSKLQELLQKVKLLNMAEKAAKMDRNQVQDRNQPASHKQ